MAAQATSTRPERGFANVPRDPPAASDRRDCNFEPYRGRLEAVSQPFAPCRAAQDAPPPRASSSGLFAMTRLASPNSANSCAWFFASPR